MNKLILITVLSIISNAYSSNPVRKVESAMQELQVDSQGVELRQLDINLTEELQSLLITPEPLSTNATCYIGDNSIATIENSTYVRYRFALICTQDLIQMNQEVLTERFLTETLLELLKIRSPYFFQEAINQSPAVITSTGGEK